MPSILAVLDAIHRTKAIVSEVMCPAKCVLVVEDVNLHGHHSRMFVQPFTSDTRMVRLFYVRLPSIFSLHHISAIFRVTFPSLSRYLFSYALAAPCNP